MCIRDSLLNADMYENWTDVSGILMADPRIVTHPKRIHTITYSELRELSYMGASVPVSYTHLDVYKRQELNCALSITIALYYHYTMSATMCFISKLLYYNRHRQNFQQVKHIFFIF